MLLGNIKVRVKLGLLVGLTTLMLVVIAGAALVDMLSLIHISEPTRPY